MHKPFRNVGDSHFKHISWQPIVPLVVIALALYVVVPQFGQFTSTIDTIKSANIATLLLAFVSISAAVLASAGAYRVLAFRKIPYTTIAVVQWAGMFINRLLPAGIGGMGLNAVFLYRNKHAAGRASTVVMVNNLLGFTAHVTFIVFSLVVLKVAMPRIEFPASEVWIGAAVLLLAITISLFVSTKIIRAGKVARFMKDMKKTVGLYRGRLGSLTTGYAWAICNTGMHMVALSFVLEAFGYGFNLGLAIIVLTGGVAAATVSPTPGGVLGSEAGITTVLVAYGTPLAAAFAVALTYRFISYWLPMAPGIVAFLYARRQRYI